MTHLVSYQTFSQGTITYVMMQGGGNNTLCMIFNVITILHLILDHAFVFFTYDLESASFLVLKITEFKSKINNITHLLQSNYMNLSLSLSSPSNGRGLLLLFSILRKYFSLETGKLATFLFFHICECLSDCCIEEEGGAGVMVDVEGFEEVVNFCLCFKR